MDQEVLHKVVSAPLIIARAHGLRHRESQDARQKHHEGVDDTLNQRHRYHVAIGDVGDFVAEYAFEFTAAHRKQEPPGDRHERT